MPRFKRMLINSAWAIAIFLVSGSRTTRMGRRDDGETPLDLDDLPQPHDFTPPRKPREPFPPAFLWGAANAAIQAEGCIKNTDWHLFTTDDEIIRRVKGLSEFVGPTYNLEPIDTAVHHRDLSVLKKDLDRAVVLGLNAYRFSIEWARVIPTESGEADEEALQYYSDAIDAMRERKLEPIVTLNHVSLPLWICTPPVTSARLAGLPDFAVEDQEYRDHSGWENPETIGAFKHFVNVVLKKLGAKVTYWITLNEPTSMATIGYLGGIWPPGFSMEGDRARRAYFNLMKAHVRAFGAIKNHYRDAELDPPKVGIALAIVHFSISSEVWAEAQALVEGAFWGGVIGAVIGGILGASVGLQVGGIPGAVVGLAVGAAIGGVIGAAIGAVVGTIWGHFNDVNVRARDQADYFYNQHLLDSLTNGSVDQAIRYVYAERNLTDAVSFFGLDDDTKFQPQLDFIGVNYYRNANVHYNAFFNNRADYTGGAIFNNDLRQAKDLAGENYRNEEHRILNDLGWDMFPEGLAIELEELSFYDLPLMITENGFAETSDRNRAPYILAHLAQIGRAANNGVEVIGYCYWSLVDNFEWQKGYEPESRFGLFEVVRPNDEEDDLYHCDKTPPGQTFKRRITDGALALQYFIANNRVIKENHLEEDLFSRAIERFGIMSDDGKSIQPPTRQAGALWHAVVHTRDHTTSSFRLYLTELVSLPALAGLPDPERRKWLGMIFDIESSKWIRLSNILVIFEPNISLGVTEVTLQFERPFSRILDGTLQESVEAYRATTTLSSTPGVFNPLDGIATRSPLPGISVTDRWIASRVLNVGLWAAPDGGSGSLTHLAIRNWEGEAFRPFQLKYLANFLPDWQPKSANTTWDDSTLSISNVSSFEDPSLTLGTLNATLTGPTLTGLIENQTGAFEQWTATRVAEDVRF
jgi:beta-glucosidase/6-phospho-beta-glucosidase/beta-galactosidase